MSCSLTKVDARNFTGTTGNSVQLKVDSDSGKAFLVSAVYAGKAFSTPWLFTIVKGANQLLVLFEDPTDGDPVRIQEACAGGGGVNTLRQFEFDPVGPSQSFVITGL
jgi:hypothetical protein